MCGRYFTDSTVTEELHVIFGVPRKEFNDPETKDVHPSDTAEVLACMQTGVQIRQMKWGFPGFEKNRLIFNARAESALEKRMFQDNIRSKRIIVPSRGFYEWDSQKNKKTFQRKDQKALLMAGCWEQFGTEQRFVILTTKANESVQGVHHRMPLILDPKDAEVWLLDDGQTEFLLHKVPCALENKSDYEQLAFSFLSPQDSL